MLNRKQKADSFTAKINKSLITKEAYFKTNKNCCSETIDSLLKRYDNIFNLLKLSQK